MRCAGRPRNPRSDERAAGALPPRHHPHGSVGAPRAGAPTHTRLEEVPMAFPVLRRHHRPASPPRPRSDHRYPSAGGWIRRSDHRGRNAVSYERWPATPTPPPSTITTPAPTGLDELTAREGSSDGRDEGDERLRGAVSGDGYAAPGDWGAARHRRQCQRGGAARSVATVSRSACAAPTQRSGRGPSRRAAAGTGRHTGLQPVGWPK